MRRLEKERYGKIGGEKMKRLDKAEEGMKAREKGEIGEGEKIRRLENDGKRY